MAQVSRNSNPLTKYKDILEIHRVTSDFMWTSRELNLTKSYIQRHDTTNPYKFQDDVLRSDNIQELIESLSSNDKHKKKLNRERVIELLRDIGHTRNVPIIRCIGYLFTKTFKKMASGIYINEAQILKLKSEMGNNPVILVPSHRSYSDFLTMNYVTYHFDIEIPSTVAAIDFQSMWLFGKLMRDCNAFFIRRSFGDDYMYRAVFKEYIQNLLVNGDVPIEFFIEGTRSRSGKALTPKFGLLSILTEVFFKGQVPDITFVPVSFNYERVLEDSLFSYEMLGVPKPKESSSKLLNSMRLFDLKYGNIYATVGEPISLRKYLTQNLDIKLDFTTRNPVKETRAITDLAYHIVNSQQSNMVMTNFNLVAIVINNHLMTESVQPLLLNQASKDVAWLSAVLSTLGATLEPISHSAAASVVTKAINLHNSFIDLSVDGAIHLKTGCNERYKHVDKNKLKGHVFSLETMNLVVPMLILQQYVNPSLHFLVNPAIITLIMQQVGTSGHITKYDLFRKYQFLKGLLANEFVFHKPQEEQEFEDALTKLELVSIIDIEPLRLGNHQKLQALLCNLIYPFLSGYLTICVYLQNSAKAEQIESSMIQSIQKTMEDGISRGLLRHPYCLSIDMISSCLSVLCSLNVLSRNNIGSELRYSVNHDNLIPILTELEHLVNLPQKYQRKDDDTVEDTAKTLHVMSSSGPMEGLVSKL